jgi:PAS domain S-box-containing protein
MTSVWEWLFGRPLQERIDRRVAERMRDLANEAARVETALRGANMHIFFQDRELRYLSVISPQGGSVGTQLLGRTDEEVLPSTQRDTVIAAKRKVMATGKPLDCDVTYVTPEGGSVFALHIEPAIGPDNRIEGVSCSAVDVTRVRSLEGEQRRLSDELKTAVQRYQLALRESNVTVFTQDRSFQYTSISNPFGGLPAADIIGRTDENILNEDSRDAVIALKRQALETGSTQNAEIGIGFIGGGVRWFDLHIELLRDLTGQVIGLIGAAVDITRRKDDEAHQRLLMRELTHRSKNLLAVIQAMARQTARHTTSLQAFIEQFDARLQALATSHDALIDEGWHGASLDGLARLQLQPFLESRDKVSIEGPTVLLKPEAAQALGLAFHELANNAKKFGALSVENGQVSITWRRVAQPEGDGVVLKWTESGGPSVKAPSARRFGSMVIERNLEQTLGGRVSLAFHAEGVQCDILIPPTHLVGSVESRDGASLVTASH